MIFVQSYEISNFFKKTVIFYEGNAKFLGYILEVRLPNGRLVVWIHTPLRHGGQSAVSPPCLTEVKQKGFFMSDTISVNTAYSLMFKSYPEVVGISDICKMLNIGRNKAYQLVNSGILKRIPCSREIRVAKITVINYVLQSAQ